MAELDAAPWRMSLRMMLLLTALAAFGCAALAYADEWWLLATGAVSMLLLMGAVVATALDRGPRQAFAIGFLLCALLHLAALRWVDQLPTRVLLERAYYLAGPDRFHLGRSNAAPATGPASNGSRAPGELKYGDTGAPVQALQAALNAELTPSPNLEVDGDFGGQTRRAVMALQTAAGHPVDGAVTLATWRALGSTGLRELRRCSAAGFLMSAPGEQFVEIDEWLVTLAIAFAGGFFAQSIDLRRRREALRAAQAFAGNGSRP